MRKLSYIAVAILMFIVTGCGSGSEGTLNSAENSQQQGTNSPQGAASEVPFAADEGTGSAWGGGPAALPQNARFQLPIADYTVSRDFGYLMSNGTRHLGQDIPAAPGITVKAVAPGRIVFSTFRPGAYNWGGITILQADSPGDPFYVIFGHLNQSALLPVGTTVQKGDQIGVIENAGTHSWVTHLHFQLGIGTFALMPGWLSPPGYAASTTGYENPFQFLAVRLNTTITTPVTPTTPPVTPTTPPAPVISPMVQVNPGSGTTGTTFNEPGTGFTANNTATLYFYRPDGTLSPTLSETTSSNGTYQHTFTVQSGTSRGWWTYHACDNATGKCSPDSRFQIY